MKGLSKSFSASINTIHRKFWDPNKYMTVGDVIICAGLLGRSTFEIWALLLGYNGHKQIGQAWEAKQASLRPEKINDRGIGFKLE